MYAYVRVVVLICVLLGCCCSSMLVPNASLYCKTNINKPEIGVVRALYAQKARLYGSSWYLQEPLQQQLEHSQCVLVRTGPRH